MTERLIKVKDTGLCYVDYSEETRSVVGTVTGGSGTAGKLKVKGIYLYYIDYSGDERKILGDLTGNHGTAGGIWIKGNYIIYIDNAGDERRIGPAATIYTCYLDENPSFFIAQDANWVTVQTKDPYGYSTAAGIQTFVAWDRSKFYIRRMALKWDTSAVPIGSTILEAYFYLYCYYSEYGNPPYYTETFQFVDAALWDGTTDPDNYALLDGWTDDIAEITLDPGDPYGYRKAYIDPAKYPLLILEGITKIALMNKKDIDNLDPGHESASLYAEGTLNHKAMLIIKVQA